MQNSTVETLEIITIPFEWTYQIGHSLVDGTCSPSRRSERLTSVSKIYSTLSSEYLVPKTLKELGCLSFQ